MQLYVCNLSLSVGNKLVIVIQVSVYFTPEATFAIIPPIFAIVPFNTDGDYETSSEGPILSKLSRAEVHGAPKESLCGYSEEKSTSLSKRAGLDSDGSPIKREVIPDPQSKLVESWLTQQTAVAHSLVSVSKSLVDSRSLPILRSKTPSDTLLVNLKATDVASESSMARKKKMSMIVERMVPLMAPYPSMASVTTGSTSNFRSEQYEARRFETKMALPVLRVRS